MHVCIEMFYRSFSLTFYSVFIVHCMHLSVRLFFLLFYIRTLSSEINELIDWKGVILSVSGLTAGFVYVCCATESGCGNAVLRIYSNKSTMPTHELCGISDEEIVSAANSVRFKSVTSNSLLNAFVPFSCLFRPPGTVVPGGLMFCCGFFPVSYTHLTLPTILRV